MTAVVQNLEDSMKILVEKYNAKFIEEFSQELMYFLE